jgi:V-type H+-transporting ATPase subunit E
MMLGGGETDAFELKRMMRQEAHEKAFEIQVQTQRLYEKERDKLIQLGMAQLEEDYSKKVQKLTQSLNIERSTKVNEARLKKMKERNDCMDAIREETKDHMLRSVVNPENLSYRNAVKNLIIQSMIKLLEKELIVRCRREDVRLLKDLIPECEKEYEAIMKKEV